ncbi:DUF3267 domain-containing protein [Salinarchaeum laminariae]|uniref:DUF3267 domain-containing protein n=1 Tax=Salinarchaeum laminariae TaxID=869888 RepID=UPI0020C169AC|nr:DUF3267 domain-containing protein [Salinarchaeum laminariae]
MSTETETDSATVLADLELSRSLTIQWAVVGTMGVGVALGAFSAIYQLATGETASYVPISGGVEWWIGPLTALAVIALTIAIIVPHEWLHGLAIRYYGGEPRYGVGLAHFVLPYAYATTDHRFSRNEFVVVALTPLIVVTLIGVPLMVIFEWGWLALPLAANAGGAVGDLWMAMVLLGYPSHVQAEDHTTGIRILGRPGDEPRDLPMTRAAWDALVGAAVVTIGTLVVLSLGGLFVLDAIGAESFTAGTPGTPTFLFEYVNTPEEISVSVGSGVLVLGALLGLCYSFVRSYLRVRTPAPWEGA